MTVSIFMNTYLVPDVPTDFAFEAWKEKVVHEAAGSNKAFFKHVIYQTKHC